MTSEEVKVLKGNNDLNLESIGFLLQKLPWNIILIFKATHLITIHISKFGSTDRTKFLRFSNYWIQALSKSNSSLTYWYLKLNLYFKLFLFEYWFPLFKLILRLSILHWMFLSQNWLYLDLRYHHANNSIIDAISIN